MQLAAYLGLIHRAEGELGRAFREIGDGHAEEPDVLHVCRTLAAQCEVHHERLSPFAARYGEGAPDEPERLHSTLFSGVRSGGLGLLRDLQDLYLMTCECDITWTVVGQAAQALRDTDLLAVVTECQAETAVQGKWLKTRMKQAAPQALVVAS
jgi:hypothetical protein